MKTKKTKRCDKKVILSDQLALKQLRQELRLSQKEAGEKLQLSHKSVGAIENGRVSLDRNRIEKIVISYGLTYLDFVRAKRIIEKEGHKKPKRQFTRKVLKNSDRRSYQTIITKECKVLRSMRRMKKLSQDEASRLCGYSRATIGHIENGRIELTEERIRHIVESYGYSYRYYKLNLLEDIQRDSILDDCISQIESLNDEKLALVKGILNNIQT